MAVTTARHSPPRRAMVRHDESWLTCHGTSWGSTNCYGYPCQGHGGGGVMTLLRHAMVLHGTVYIGTP